ncbi:MAG: helix-turn-helix domain-containing protein [Candidatus Bipolaricaulis sp.]|nr:helix-turn-helix domain-containing protein [Candidatus Bipolaricaulis sp.]MDD5219660.1 helix-turn-helix domain-containing protein [Candidatus Bipolaricaulis sp.]MDD5647045.1 helix-turn-helix domain-containing protein [Candidatus Bipolaricaulis sp.]
MSTESDDLVLRRKEILELSDRLGNVSEACRRAGIPRSSYYEYRRRFRKDGLAGLRDRPPVHRSHPMSTPKAIEDRLVRLSVEHPSWGCVRLAASLRASGVSISSPTVQKLLARRGLGTARERWLRMETLALTAPGACTAEQLAWIEALNPAFRERERESSRPGATLLQDVRAATRATRVYVHFVIDSYGGAAFATLGRSRNTADAVKLLSEHVLPFYASLGEPIESLITPDVPVFWGSPRRHPFEKTLARAGIDHRAEHPSAARRNGFLERFWQDVQVEFVTPRRAEWRSAPIRRWQAEFAEWLAAYNTTRPYLGYRNQGASPYAFIHLYKEKLNE